jgi:hypothetical protein
MRFTPIKILLLQFVAVFIAFLIGTVSQIASIAILFPVEIYLYSKLIACTCPDCGANLGALLQNMSLSNGKCLKCNAKRHNT